MIVATAALTATLLASAPLLPAPSYAADAPTAERVGLRLAALRTSEVPAPGTALRYTLDDAPTTPVASLLASGLTGVTGLFVGALALLSTPEAALPGSTFSFHLRLSTALFLLSAGPSMGDLLNENVGGFLLGALGRSALAAGGYGLVLWAMGSGSNVGVVMLSVLGVGLGSLLWTGWSVVDLFRSWFAPQRWVERHNRALAAGAIPSREPIIEVRQTGGLRLLSI